MTPRQREKLREQRRRKKERERQRVERRKEKRRIKAAPKKALAEWSREILSCGKCEVCGVGVTKKLDKDGKPKRNKRGKLIFVRLNAHHLLPKETYPGLKFCPKNGICVCPKCHRFGKYSFHKNPIWAALWLQTHKPIQYNWVQRKVKDPYEVRRKTPQSV